MLAFVSRPQPIEEPGQAFGPPGVCLAEVRELLRLILGQGVAATVTFVVDVETKVLEHTALARTVRRESHDTRAVDAEGQIDQFQHRVDKVDAVGRVVWIGPQVQAIVLDRIQPGRRLPGDVRLHAFFHRANRLDVFVEFPLVTLAQFATQAGCLIRDQVEDAAPLRQPTFRIGADQFRENGREVEVGQHRSAFGIEGAGVLAAVGANDHARPARLPANRACDVLIDGDRVRRDVNLFLAGVVGIARQPQCGFLVTASGPDVLQAGERREAVAQPGQIPQRRRQLVVLAGGRGMPLPHVHTIGNEEKNGAVGYVHSVLRRGKTFEPR